MTGLSKKEKATLIVNALNNNGAGLGNASVFIIEGVFELIDKMEKGAEEIDRLKVEEKKNEKDK